MQYDEKDDGIQHGLDDNPTGDAEKGATLGGVGGAVTGAIAGAAAGPVGAVVGAVVGGVAGAVGSGLAVAAVDRVDNDNTVTGVGNTPTYTGTGDRYNTTTTDVLPGNDVPGAQTGGRANDGTPDTRGITEKAADTVTGDPYDDKTGKRVDAGTYANDPAYRTTNENRVLGDPANDRVVTGTDAMLGNDVPGIQTGGRAADGTPDTRGITEKTADALTGDDIDDKSGKRVY